QADYDRHSSVSDQFNTPSQARRLINPTLKTEGSPLTMYEARTNLTSAAAADLRGLYGSLVCATTIPRNVRLDEAPSYGKPIIHYEPRSRGAESYLQLAKEVLAHDKETVRSRAERTALSELAASG